MQSMSVKHLILGSGSSSRKSILQSAGISFDICKADIDERAIGNRSHAQFASELVIQLGIAKANAIIHKIKSQQLIFPSNILLTADQVVTCDGEILEKPDTIEEVRFRIKKYGSFPCSTVGSIVLTDLQTMKQVYGIDTTTIHLDHIPDNVIDSLIEEGEIMHSAGGLMIEHPLIQPYILKTEGTVDSIMGLSLDLLNSLLEKLQQN